MKVGIISCAKMKRPGTHPAKELYTSTLFRFAWEYAKRSCDRVFILSAKYGLLTPEQPISSYDQTLSLLSNDERNQWGRDVVRILARELSRDDTLVLLCGEMYRKPVIEHFGQTHICEVPLRGLGFGKQLQWYKKRLVL